MLVGVIFWILCGIGAAMIALSKNRSGCNWFGAGLLLGPIALLIVGFMAPGEAPTNLASQQSQLHQPPRVPDQLASPQGTVPKQTRDCPFCAETILAKAIVCRYCNRDLPPLAVPLEQPTAANPSAWPGIDVHLSAEAAPTPLQEHSRRNPSIPPVNTNIWSPTNKRDIAIAVFVVGFLIIIILVAYLNHAARIARLPTEVKRMSTSDPHTENILQCRQAITKILVDLGKVIVSEPVMQQKQTSLTGDHSYRFIVQYDGTYKDAIHWCDVKANVIFIVFDNLDTVYRNPKAKQIGFGVLKGAAPSAAETQRAIWVKNPFLKSVAPRRIGATRTSPATPYPTGTARPTNLAQPTNIPQITQTARTDAP